ncbi:hypothetical protein HDU76_003135 [Blyttiomyces sp. JEL0837]|nr:hypothetical protein HDU76_003135 [Blyttiomyces sp. JEL0837]
MGIPGVAKSSLFAFVNALQSQNDEEIHKSCIAAIAGLAPVLKAKQTIEMAIPALTKKLGECASEDVRTNICECLGVIGYTCEEEVFEEVLSLIFSGPSILIAKAGYLISTRTPYYEKLLEVALHRFIEQATGLKEV